MGRQTQRDMALATSLRQYMRSTGVTAQADPGKYAELAITSALQTYVANAEPRKQDGKRPDARRSMASDFLLGTDLLIDDPARMLLKDHRILRLDVTIGFTKKDNMPLITPTPSMSLTDNMKRPCVLPIGDKGDYMRFGIRIGNGNHGFTGPVVVAGLCSSRELDPGRVQDNVRWLQDNVMQNAPQIIHAANLTLRRFRYMTDPDVKARMEARESPQDIDKRLPALVGNWAYLEQLQKKQYAPGKKASPRMCMATVVDAIGDVVRDPDTAQAVRFRTDVPWMSPMCHRAIAAMLDGPRRMPASTEKGNMATIQKLLDEPVREPKRNPPIVVDSRGRELVEGRSTALRNLAKELDKTFDDSPDDGIGPWKR